MAERVAHGVASEGKRSPITGGRRRRERMPLHEIDAGVAISVVSERLRHANAVVTLGAYTHQLRDSQAKAACVVAALVRKAAN